MIVFFCINFQRSRDRSARTLLRNSVELEEDSGGWTDWDAPKRLKFSVKIRSYSWQTSRIVNFSEKTYSISFWILSLKIYVNIWVLIEIRRDFFIITCKLVTWSSLCLLSLKKSSIFFLNLCILKYFLTLRIPHKFSMRPCLFVYFCHFVKFSERFLIFDSEFS